MDTELKLKLVENRRRVEEEYKKNRVRCRRPASAAVDGHNNFTSKPAGNKDVDLKLKFMENRPHVEEEYMKNCLHCRPDILRQKSGPSKPPGNKRKAPEPAPAAPARKKVDGDAPELSACTWGGKHYVFLFEFALGYALFDARGLNKYPGWVTTFKIAEKYLNSNPFTLRAFYRFPSPGDALLQMKAICTSTVTKELKSFVADNIPEPSFGYVLVVSNSRLGFNIAVAARRNYIGGNIFHHVMRGLRVKIDKLIVGLEPGELKMAQLNLARSYRRQSRARQESSNVQRIVHNVIADKVMVEPHKFEGLYITKGLGKKNFICTKNLVPGKVLYGDQLISVKNEDDRTEVEYRVWNPHVSKLAAAVQSGVTNIWVKPGSHVLYLGNVCGITVLQLSDLVGSDGLVYVIGSVANTVEERSNVVTLPENNNFRMGDEEYFYNGGSSDFRRIRGMDYRMVIGMVDVILGDIIYSSGPTRQLGYIFRYAQLHLKTGGHYLVSTRPENNNRTSQVKDPFADEAFPCHMRMEFETNELVMLEPIGRGHAMVVGSYRLK